MKVLLQGNFDSCCEECRQTIKANSSHRVPNLIYRQLLKVIRGHADRRSRSF